MCYNRSFTGNARHEIHAKTHVEPQKKKDPRISHAHADPIRPRHTGPPAKKGKTPPHGVNVRAREPHGAWLRVKIDERKSPNALVISVPKRVVPLSTRRSRLKRLIREAFRLSGAKFPNESAYHFTVNEFPRSELKMQDVLAVIKVLLRELES